VTGFSLGFVARIRTGAWFSRDRIVAYSGILLICELATLAFFIAGTHGWIVPLRAPTSTDFASFYAAGRLADAGTPALVYDQAAHYAAEQQATEAGIGYQFFYYPPIFLLLCAPLALLPYMTAFIVFQAATLFGYLCVARAVIREQGWPAMLPLLAFPSVLWTMGLGQNAFLTASLFGGATLLIDRRPILAGLLFGALCYKPHFGLLIPVALAAGRCWPAFAAAAASVAGLLLLSVACFGVETWHAFLTTAAGSPGTYASGRIDLSGLVTPFAAALVMGGGAMIAYLFQGAATLGAALLVVYVWRGNFSLPLRAATLLACCLLAVPVVLIYDLMLAAIAAAWLVRAGKEVGFLPWEKAALAGLFILPLFSRNLGSSLGLPISSLAVVALFVAVLGRLREEIAARKRSDRGPSLWPAATETLPAG
jgi:hypothetical protein